MSLARDVAGLHFPNPLLLASGTAAYGVELAGVMDLARLGGLVTKAVSLEPRPGNRAPRVAEFHGGMLNSVGLANPGVEHVAANELPALARLGLPGRILVNVVGFTRTEYSDVIRALDGMPGHDGYEINLSCPNTSAGGVEFGADPVSVTDVVASCRAATSRPLFAKLSPALADIPAIASAAAAAGADGISLINTMPGMLYDGRTPRVGSGLGGASGPVLLASGVLAVRRVRDRLPGVAIIGVGGIRGLADAMQYLDAGADLIAMGTAALADPRAPMRLVRDLERHFG